MKINSLKNVKKSKVDGLIVVDLPFPENKIFASKCKKKILILFNLFHLQHQKRLKKLLKILMI